MEYRRRDYEKDMQQPGGKAVRLRTLTLAVLTAIGGAALLVTGCGHDAVRDEAGAEGQGSVAEAKLAYKRQNYGVAARMLEGPAIKGDAEAQYALGYMYYYGKGVPRDRQRARTWFEDAAYLGNEDAKKALALLRAYGQLPPLPEDARRHIVPSAPDAQESAVPLDAGASEGVIGNNAGPDAQAPTPAAASQGMQDTSVPQPIYKQQAAPVNVTTAPGASSFTSVRQQESSNHLQHESLPPGAPPPSSTHSGTEPIYAQKMNASGRPMGATPSAKGGEPSATAYAQAELAKLESSDERMPSAEDPRYTLYLICSRDKADLKRLIRKHDLAHPVSYYEMESRGITKYHLIYGEFDTITAARAALKALPEALRKYVPWVNHFPESVDLTPLRV